MREQTTKGMTGGKGVKKEHCLTNIQYGCFKLFYLLVLSADNFCKQFGPRSQNVGPGLDPICLTHFVFLKEFFLKVESADKKEHENFPRGQRVNRVMSRSYLAGFISIQNFIIRRCQ